MVSISALWLPIVLSAVAVFIGSALIHMVLGYHDGDKAQLPGETAVMKALRDAGVKPGNYMFPHCDRKKMNDPATVEKFKQGPIGMLNVLPSGPPAMGKSLALWFAYCLVVGGLVAYITGRTVAPAADYLAVFRVAGAAAFLAYAGAEPAGSIWFGRKWSSTIKHMIDGLIYALLTAGVFGWLWPR